MPTIQIQNVSGYAVNLVTSGSIQATVPSGYNAGLTLDGTYNVIAQGVPQVEMLINSVTQAATNGQCGVAVINNSSQALYATGGAGSAGASQFAVGVAGTIHSGTGFETLTALPVTPNFQSASLTIVDTQGGGLGGSWAQLAVTSTNYTTNIVAQVLGNFTSSYGLKSVTIHPQSIAARDYGREVQGFSVGLGLAFTVLVFAFILRLLRAIPSQGGDF